MNAIDNFQSLMTPERKERYLSRRQEDLTACWAALRESDFKALQDVAHKVKGTARSFGFNDLEAIAVKLEEQAIEKNEKEIADLLQKFDTSIRLLS
jgi:HPt (histidine-containing phosphotransfer) domain-containing protein